MCIRDRAGGYQVPVLLYNIVSDEKKIKSRFYRCHPVNGSLCLLYTSDAADERSSVDLGGRRLIKKNK